MSQPLTPEQRAAAVMAAHFEAPPFASYADARANLERLITEALVETQRAADERAPIADLQLVTAALALAARLRANGLTVHDPETTALLVAADAYVRAHEDPASDSGALVPTNGAQWTRLSARGV